MSNVHHSRLCADCRRIRCSLGGLLIPMLLMLVIFYFLLIRPQSQRAKQQRDRVNAVRRGDTVITSGGMVGKVTKASDTSDEIEVELPTTSGCASSRAR